EASELREKAQAMKADWREHREAELRAVDLQLDNVSTRSARLTDMYLDNAIERSVFDEKKRSLVMVRKALEEQRAQVEAGQQSVVQDMLRYLELMETLPLSYESGNVD